MGGADVKPLETALLQHGFCGDTDGVFGPAGSGDPARAEALAVDKPPFPPGNWTLCPEAGLY